MKTKSFQNTACKNQTGLFSKNKLYKNNICIILLTFVIISLSCKKEEPVPQNTTIIHVDVTESITTPTTWTANKEWIVDGTVYIDNDLIIEPGTIIRFKKGAELIVGYNESASIKAAGLKDNTIKFTSAAVNPSPGDWRGLHFYDKNSSSASELKYCTIEYAGVNDSKGLINLDNTSIKIENCNLIKSAGYGLLVWSGAKFSSCKNNYISECDDHPIYTDVNAVATIDSSNTILSKDQKGIYIHNYDLTGKVKWFKHESPYIIEFIRFNNNAELTIFQGAELQFNGNGYLEIGYDGYGRLEAVGTVNEPIIFTSSAGSPSSGDWSGIKFYNGTTGNSIINNCIISYAGKDGYAGILLNECGNKVTIKNTKINNSSSCGIYNYYSSPVIQNCIYYNCTGEVCTD